VLSWSRWLSVANVACDMAASPRDVVNVFSLLQDSMSAEMWGKVAQVLEDVLDPAQGGDERLHALLRRTLRAHHEQRQRAS